MIKAKHIILCIIATALLSGCRNVTLDPFNKAVAQWEGEVLYWDDIRSVMPTTLRGEDSADFVKSYIHSWLGDKLLYQKAKRNVSFSNQEIDQMVEEYRKSLIMFKYQQELVNEKLSLFIDQEQKITYYNQHKDNFLLSKNWIKGIYIKTPINAPDLVLLRSWTLSSRPVELEKIEKFCLKNMGAYEYFYDTWMDFSIIEKNIPYQIENHQKLFCKKGFYELKDSTYYYFLNITETALQSDIAPYELVENQIKDILLHQRKNEFLRQFVSDMIDRAEKNGDVTYYNQKNE